MSENMIQDAEFSTVETGTAIALTGETKEESKVQVQTIHLPEPKQKAERNEGDAPSIIGKVFWRQVPGFREISKEAGSSVVDAFEESGLNWTTSKRPIQVVGGNTIPDTFAICRDDTGRSLGIVGSTWRPIPNATKFAHLEPWLKSGNTRIVGVGEFNGGEKVSVVLEMSRALQEIRVGDEMGAYLIVTDHFDGRRGAAINLFTLRLACTNGMTMKAHLGNAQLRHSRYGEQNFIARLGDLQGVYLQYDKMIENQKLLAQRNVPGQARLLEYVSEAMELKSVVQDGKQILITRSANVFQDIKSRFESGKYGLGKGTWFDAVQAIAEYRTHGMGRSRVTRLDSLLHGPNALASQRDIQLALEMSA